MANINRKKRILWIIIIVLLVNLIGMCVATVLIYDATFPRYDVDDLPYQTADREVTFLSGDNRLWGGLYEGERDALIVLAPGYRAFEGDYLHLIYELQQRGWAVFFFEPTGCCRSEGDSSVGFAQETLDLHAALDFVESEGRFGYEKLMLLGHSRGGNAVCGALQRDITAAVTVNALGSDMEAIVSPVENVVGPLAYGNYPIMWLYQKVLFGKYGCMKTADCIEKSDIPVLVVQGSADTTATPTDTALYADKEDISSPRVEYYLCDKEGQNGHTDLLFDPDQTANNALVDKIHGFFEKYTGE